MTRLIAVCVSAVLLAALGSTPEALSEPRGYVAPRVTTSVSVDGALDEDAWKSVPWSDEFVDIEGNVRPKPRHRTRVKMAWDMVYFYVGAELDEPHLWGTLTEHDSVIFRDNDFEVFIDPNGDNHEYYELEINALGTTWDLLLPKPYKDDGKAVNGWEIAGLKSAVRLDGTLNDPRDQDRGWSVELALPWKALGELARRPAPPRDGDQWRVNFSRVQWQLQQSAGKYEKVPGTSEANWVWSPQGVVDMHRPERWGYVQFSTAPGGAAKFAMDPDHAARDVLHAWYYAQRDFRKGHGRWAGTLTELFGAQTQPADRNPAAFDGRLAVAGDQFEMSVRARPDSTERWYIRQDSLVWKK